MRRNDRLFELIQILRDGRLHRAAELADRLGVSVRTIWRDTGALMASGLPLEGERGVGYILRAPTTLPPMILTSAEMDALRLGMRMVARGEDAAMARAARSLAAKIAAVLPAAPEAEADDIFVFTGDQATRAMPHMPLLRHAIRARARLSITYIDVTGQESHREIRPLLLDLAGRVWTLAAWCETRGGFRSFRLDRIVAIQETGEHFAPEPGRELADFRAAQQAGI
ncbi:helix-turn-helix transcriptional regulator [Gemmobacter serpentinus]|uniref:helix-turn-helix transcriptional regulator n=1 Tax=Gemmobacter serpentinus TaxID=2652247 RepID=UPI00124DA84C|nr:YafY family protein [Gemmobacter serpentinus]